MSSSADILQTTIWQRHLTKSELRKIILRQTIKNLLAAPTSDLSIKTKGYILNSISEILLKQVSLMLFDINEFRISTFIPKKAVAPGTTRKRRSSQKKTRRKPGVPAPVEGEPAVEELGELSHQRVRPELVEAEIDRLAQEALSSQKNQASEHQISIRKGLSPGADFSGLKQFDSSGKALQDSTKMAGREGFDFRSVIDQTVNFRNTSLAEPGFLDRQNFSAMFSADKTRMAETSFVGQKIKSGLLDLLLPTQQEQAEMSEQRKKQSLSKSKKKKPTVTKSTAKKINLIRDSKNVISPVIQEQRASRERDEGSSGQKKQGIIDSALKLHPLKDEQETMQSINLFDTSSDLISFFKNTRNNISLFQNSILNKSIQSVRGVGGAANPLLEFLGDRSISSSSKGGISGQKSHPGSESDRNGEIDYINQLSTILEVPTGFDTFQPYGVPQSIPEVSGQKSRLKESRGVAPTPLKKEQNALLALLHRKADKQGGRTNIGKLFEEKKAQKSLKARMFYNLLGIVGTEFVLEQSHPESFSDIFAVKIS